jgi:hypothetical protein
MSLKSDRGLLEDMKKRWNLLAQQLAKIDKFEVLEFF